MRNHDKSCKLIEQNDTNWDMCDVWLRTDFLGCISDMIFMTEWEDN
jgi:hypothetical protein